MAGDMQADIPESGAVFTYGRSRFANNIASYFFIRNDPIAAISCGDEHTAIVCQNGRVFTFGSNSWGQLGLGHKNTITMPSCMKSLKPEKANQIACGKSHTVISTVSGKVFTCGSNANGQLGIPEVTERTTPTQVTGIEVKPGGIKQVSAGCFHSACLTDDGKVYVWGTNTDGQLGLGDVVATADVPSLVKLSKPAVHISCGYYHTAFVTDDGKLYICGEGENGKLGLSESTNVFTPTLVGIDSPVKYVACGGNHTIAITKNSDVYAFGSNLQGQLGLESKVEFSSVPNLVSALTGKQIQYVACGESHSAFVTAKGQFYVCGDARYGKLCKDVNNEDEDVSGFMPQRVERFDNYDVTLVACGGCHTMVHAAARTSRGKGSPNGNNQIDLILDHVESMSPNQNLQAGDSINRLPRSARLPPLNVGRQNGSILDSPSVEVAPGNVEKITVASPKQVIATPPKTVTATPPKPVIATPPKTVTSSPSKQNTVIPPKNESTMMENMKDSDNTSSETAEDAENMNGDDTARPTRESLEEVLHKLNVKDASELSEFVALEKAGNAEGEEGEEGEAKEEGEDEEGDQVKDTLAASGNTVVLSQVIKSETDAEPTREAVSNEEEVTDEEGENEDEEEATECEELPENGEEMAEVELENEDGKGIENEVPAEQENQTEEMREEKKPTTAEQVESRVSKFLSAFRRKKLSEGNLALSPAWTTVDRKISSDNTIVNNRKADKPGVTRVKSGQPQRSKACVIL